MSKTFDRQTFSARTTFSTSDARIKISRKKFADGKETTTLSAYPIVWNVTSSDRGGYKVRLAANSACFTDPAMALWNHDFSRPLGGTVNNTLRILAADEVGVPVEIDLDLNTTDGKNTLANVSSGLVGGMSFSMANGFEDYAESHEGNDTILTVSKYTVDEVTVTPIPAFTATSVGVKPPPPPAPAAAQQTGTPPVSGGMSDASPNRIAASHKLRSRGSTF